MAVDRPEAIDPHPEGRNEVEGGRGEAFLSREEWSLQRPGEENETGRCGCESETSVAKSASGQTCHIEDAMGRPLQKRRITTGDEHRHLRTRGNAADTGSLSRTTKRAMNPAPRTDRKNLRQHLPLPVERFGDDGRTRTRLLAARQAAENPTSPPDFPA